MERCDSGVSVVSNGINSVVSLSYGMQSNTISDLHVHYVISCCYFCGVFVEMLPDKSVHY